MFAVAEQFPEWTDFPWGLQVLLAGKDINHLNSLRLTLERSQYNVTTLKRVEDAITALQNSERSFHLALVEATQDDEFDGFKVLKAAGGVPTIMLTETENMATMMRGIVLGAADFLQIPVTEEKIRNIWQHVARKALIARKRKLQEPVKQLNDSGDSFCQSNQGACSDTQDSSCTLDSSKDENNLRHAEDERKLGTLKMPACDKLFNLQRSQEAQFMRGGSCEHVVELSPASDRSSEMKLKIQEIRREVVASTQHRLNTETNFDDYACSRVKYGSSLEDIGIRNEMILDGDGADTEIDPSIFIGLPDSDSDSVLDFNVDLLECGALPDAENEEEGDLLVSELVKLEEDSFEADMLESFLQSPSHDSGECMKEKKMDKITSNGTKKIDKLTASRKKKMKVDWTAELHHKFVQAVEHLGVEKAIPSKILELMGVKCLTRHNVASHLQKYRSHRKHHLYRETRAANWRAGRFVDLSPWVGAKRDPSSILQSQKSNLAPIQPRLPVAMYPVQPTGHFSRPPLHVWGHPAMDHSSAHMWHQPSMNAPTTWCSPDGTIWQNPAATSPALGAPCLTHIPMKIPLAPASSTIQVGIPVIHGEEKLTPDHPIDSGDSDQSIGAGTASLDKPIIHLPKEVVDAVINEALKNPITSLPLGLKPPSLESVMAGLQKQGINGTGRSL